MDESRPVRFGVFLIPQAGPRRVLNSGDQPVELLVELVVERGIDTFIVSGEDEEAMRRFAAEVAPAVRESLKSF